MLAHLDFDADDPALPMGLSLFNEEWHQGVVGLVASQVKDKVHRPVIAFARAEDGSLKGSARSVKGMHIRDALEAISTRHPGLIAKFGGHAMAAGLSLEADASRISAEAFDAEARRWLYGRRSGGVLHTDGELAPEDFTLETRGTAARRRAPGARASRNRCFDGEFRLLERRVVGDRPSQAGAGASSGLRWKPSPSVRPASISLPDCRQVRIAYQAGCERIPG